MLPVGAGSVPVFEEKQIVGGGYRPEAQCPVCDSLDRERLLHLFLLHRTDLFQRPMRLLHVAPERRLEQVLRRVKGIDYLTADIQGIEVMVAMDITRIGYPEATFDAIVCNHVLEHIPEDGRAMAELFRVLKPGGWAVLQVPISLALMETYEDPSIADPMAREAAFGQQDHVRIYGQDYAARLERAGFRVSRFQWTDEPEQFGGAENRYRLNEQEAVYQVFKPA